jgi:predicted nuclease of predicted toxin-antitoxin system
MKLLLDEHFSPEIARQLRARGHDALAVRELPDLHGLADADLLAWARTEHRTVVTENVADFVELHRRSVMRRRPHAGLILTSPRGFPRTRRAIGRIVRALDDLLGSNPDLDGQVWWL